MEINPAICQSMHFDHLALCMLYFNVQWALYIPTFLSTYRCDSGDSSDSSDRIDRINRSDSSDSSNSTANSYRTIKNN